MLQKIKELMTVKEEVGKINEKLNLTTSSVRNLQNELELLREESHEHVKNINEKNNEFFRNFDENVNLMKNIKENFEKELFDFKLLKSQTQKKILEKFEEELQKELNIKLEGLNKDADQYNELKGQISNITLKVNDLSEEMNKFLAISKNIKERDFEMTHFAKQLIDMDKEKLELMRKIDTMQKLVGRMRRTV
jgi:chromosome segregation ATPase